jgi:hypothetical protein
MICPQCKAEYRQGFTHCADCDVDLVAALSQENSFSGAGNSSATAMSEASLETVWSSEDQAECVWICRRLKSANIPYLVREPDRQFLTGPKREFVIVVSQSHSQAAKEIIDEGKFDFTDSEEDQAVMEIPTRDDRPLEEVHGDWNPHGWFPEDATLEIWNGDSKKSGSMIEMSLKENRINYRVELQREELKKVYVLPVDETRAREIVREIVEGAPPE